MTTANPLGDLVILMSFLACWQGAGMSGRAARREVARRAAGRRVGDQPSSEIQRRQQKPCPGCGATLTLYRTYAKCYSCGWTAEPNPYGGER